MFTSVPSIGAAAADATIICVRDWTMDNKSSFRRKKAGRALGVASNCWQRHELTSDSRVSDEPSSP